MNQTINLSAFWKITDSADQPTDDIGKACWLYVGPSKDARVVTIGREQHENTQSAAALAVDAYFYGTYAPESRLGEQFVLYASANPLYTEGCAGLVGPRWLAKHGQNGAWWHEFSIAMDDGRSLLERIVIGKEIDPSPVVDAETAAEAGATSSDIADMRWQARKNAGRAIATDRKYHWGALVDAGQTFKVWMAHNRLWFSVIVDQLRDVDTAREQRNEHIAVSTLKKEARFMTRGSRVAATEPVTDSPEGEPVEKKAIEADFSGFSPFVLTSYVGGKIGDEIDVAKLPAGTLVQLYMIRGRTGQVLDFGGGYQPLTETWFKTQSHLPAKRLEVSGGSIPMYAIAIQK